MSSSRQSPGTGGGTGAGRRPGGKRSGGGQSGNRTGGGQASDTRRTGGGQSGNRTGGAQNGSRAGGGRTGAGRTGGGRAGGGQARKVVRAQLAREQRRRRTLWTSIVAVAVLLIAGLIGWGVWAGQRGGEWTAPAGANAEGTGIVIGGGPVTVDLYEDFICPACGQFEERAGATLDQLVAENKIKIVYHPLSFLDRYSTTDYSTRSASASGCAAEGGKFREYTRALFDRQPPEGGPGLSDDELVEIAGTVGLDRDTFGTCLRDRTYQPWIRHVTEEASRAGVTGTPTVLVAGRPVQPTVEAITAAVTAAGR